jgi:putative tricarboxylic transport membrane protein
MDFTYLIQSFWEGLTNFSHASTLIGVTIGCFVGLLVGLLPAISNSMVVALLIPFIVGVDPMFALPMLTSMMSVNYTAGVMTTILVGIPGSSGNLATIADGFSMTRKGLGGRAIGVALMASATGGIASVVFSIALMPAVVPLVMAFRAPEMFAIILLAMCFMAAVSKGSTIKGLLSGCIGMLLGFVGYQQTTGATRWTFGSVQLYDGIGIVPIMLGLFALTILLEMRPGAKTIAPPDTSQAGNLGELWKGAKMLFSHMGLWFRSSVIGYIVGIIPGIGGETAQWVAYGQAQKTSKDPSSFGKGNIEGIIAPETSTHAGKAGDLLTTMAFGIPGSVGMAYMMVAFLVLGIQPGPKMITENANVVFAILDSVALANVIGALMCFFGATILIKVTRVPPLYLFVTIMPFTLIGAYNDSNVMTDIVIMLIITVLGVFLRKNKYPFAPCVLGFVLAAFFERYFWRALSLQGPLFFLTPISIFLILCTIFFLFNGFFIKLFKRLFTSMRRTA